MKRICALIIGIIAAVTLMPGVSFAETDAGVQRASSIEEFIDATEAGDEAYISVDKKTAAVGGKSFESYFDREYNGDSSADLKDAIEEDHMYVVTDEDKRSFEVLSIFGTRRIKVKKELSSLEGASTGVSYDGETLLSYATAADTRDAYERLAEKYGAENVIVDLPVISPDSAAGWGTDYMNMDDQIRRVKKSAGKDLPKVTVAVVDSGINSSHVLFRGTSISPLSKNMLSEGGDLSDENGHGTEVAGIIAESTPDNVEIMVVKVFGKSTNGTTEDINQAIKYSVEKGADIINLSMSNNQHEILDSMEEYYPNLIANFLRETDLQLKYAAKNGVIVCAASGNDGGDLDELYSFPSYSQFTLAVGSIDKDGNKSSFSNYGNSLDFCAPGGEVVMAANDSNNGYYVASGTSFATPYISACCAYVKMDAPDANYINAREALKAVSVDYGNEGWDKYYGWGMPHYEDFIDESGVNDGGDNTNAPKDATEQAGTAQGGTAAPASVPQASSATLNSKTITAAAVKKAVAASGGSANTIVLGKKVKKLSKGAFKGTNVKTIIVKTKKLKKTSVKGSLKGSKVTTVKVQVGKAKVNKKYAKKYKKIFTKKIVGRKIRVK